MTAPDQSLREKVALKPCPFCGEAAELEAYDQGRRTGVKCTDCGARTVLGQVGDNMVEVWNRRAEPTPTERPDLAELRRLAEGATPGPWQNGIEDLEGIVAPENPGLGNVVCIPPKRSMYSSLEAWPDNAAFIAAANPAVVLELLSEIEGLKASASVIEPELGDLEASNKDLSRLLSEAERQLADLRTQAPDSWRPSEQEVENVLRCCDAMERSVERKGLPKSEADICVATDWLRRVCAALRPQTAESGK